MITTDEYIVPKFKPTFNETIDPSQIHWTESWNNQDIKEAIHDHAIFTWGPSNLGKNAMLLKRAKGIYLYDENDKE